MYSWIMQLSFCGSRKESITFNNPHFKESELCGHSQMIPEQLLITELVQKKKTNLKHLNVLLI